MLGQPLVVTNNSTFHKVIRLSAIVSLQFLLGSWGGFCHKSVNAQITPDASLGTEASRVNPNVEIKGSPVQRIDGGATREQTYFTVFPTLMLENPKEFILIILQVLRIF